MVVVGRWLAVRIVILGSHAKLMGRRHAKVGVGGQVVDELVNS